MAEKLEFKDGTDNRQKIKWKQNCETPCILKCCEAQARVRQGKARKGKERQGWRKVKGLKA